MVLMALITSVLQSLSRVPLSTQSGMLGFWVAGFRGGGMCVNESEVDQYVLLFFHAASSFKFD